MATEEEAKNGMHLKRLLDSHQIKKLFMKDQDNLGLEVKTKEMLRQLITLSIEDQMVNLSLLLINKLDGGTTVTEEEAKNGMLSKRLLDSHQIKEPFMKDQDNLLLEVKMKEMLSQLITLSIEYHMVNLSLKLMLTQHGGPMVMVQVVKNGMLLMKSADSLKIKKNFMKAQDNHGSLVKTKKIKNHHITYSTLDQDLNLSLKLMLTQHGGPMVMVQVVKNGTHSKRLPDSPKIKKSFMKTLDSHGSQVKIKKIKNQKIIYSTQDQ